MRLIYTEVVSINQTGTLENYIHSCIIYYGFQDAELGTERIKFLAVFTFIIMFPLLLGLYRYGFQNQKIAEKVL